jgi:geranylgeranyl pyrophosphate synthase
MVGGQSVDLMIFGKAPCRTCAVRGSRDLQNLKTSALIRLSLKLGAILTGASDEELDQLSCFADRLGHAYQLSDDIIDIEQDAEGGGYPKGMGSLASLRYDLRSAVERSKSILTNNFVPCEARNCLVDLVDHMAARKD